MQAQSAARPQHDCRRGSAGRRRLLLSLPLPFLLSAPPPVSAAPLPGFPAAPNSAVVKSLQALERRRSTVRGSAETRLASALGQLQRSRQLASTGQVPAARGVLREGAMKTLRVDAQAFQKDVPDWRTELLNDYDAALRALDAAGGEAEFAAAEAAGAAFEAALKLVVDEAEREAETRVAAADNSAALS